MTTSPILSGDRTPWDLTPKESLAAYNAFRVFLEMGAARDKIAVANKVGFSPNRIRNLYNKFSWESRVRAYDEWQTKLEQEAFLKERQKAIRATAKLGAAMRDKAMAGLEALPISELTAGDIARLADIGVKVERLAYGDSTENRAVSGQIVFEVSQRPAWAEPELPPIAIPSPQPEVKPVFKDNMLAFPKPDEETA